MDTITTIPAPLYIHAFNLLPQCGPIRLLKILNFFESPERAFQGTREQFLQSGLEKDFISLFEQHRQSINIPQEADKLSRLGISLVTRHSAQYPELLSEIISPPPLLYVRGTIINSDELCLAVVGTRKITTYGRSVLPVLLAPLVAKGVTIVSGLAYGVDAAAHQIAINARRRTIAVLAGGVEEATIYPRNHVLLSDQILVNGGALISEYPPGTPALRHHFLARNRIISGISAATVIIECNLKSGSLITAKYALEQNRTVYAVPGPIYAEASRGPNNLIKMGARLITEAADIFDDLNITMLPEETEVQSTFGDSAAETALLKILTKEPMIMNTIISVSKLEASEVLSALTFLEMKGKVRNLGGQQYIIAR